MHTPSNRINGINNGAIGLLFSVDSYSISVISTKLVEAIDQFFDSLQWDAETGAPIVPYIPYGKLMSMVDMNNRWIYKGSVTTPPCDSFVYWNIPTTILPISKKHLALFKRQLARPGRGLETIGNYRNIKTISNHMPMRVTDRLNKVNFNILNQIKVTNNAQGSIDIDLSKKLHGNKAKISPSPLGLMNIEFTDILGRSINVNSDGVCQNIMMCGWQDPTKI